MAEVLRTVTMTSCIAVEAGTNVDTIVDDLVERLENTGFSAVAISLGPEED